MKEGVCGTGMVYGLAQHTYSSTDITAAGLWGSGVLNLRFLPKLEEILSKENVQQILRGQRREVTAATHSAMVFQALKGFEEKKQKWDSRDSKAMFLPVNGLGDVYPGHRSDPVGCGGITVAR